MSNDRVKILARLGDLHALTLDLLLVLTVALSFYMSMKGLGMLYDLGEGDSRATIAHIGIPFVGAGALHALQRAAQLAGLAKHPNILFRCSAVTSNRRTRELRRTLDVL